ncbi:P-loop containing nucleoside triphosphate hydrolase protein [Lentinula guzmanii]|uniref:P-loop containing nucleoside triphosphate hydrolase protein n=1 Tax=Lentinula guzmanii TaxID=2804957 RepID=A0AA38JSU2_9AGAR|nr:P-loop containing nucleoside triphosphate hydrolase protein [Lentinula guzmanii]
MAKRKNLTSDDLLRQQEQPQSKRTKLITRSRKEEAYESPSDASASSSGSVRSPLELNGHKDDGDSSDEVSGSENDQANLQVSARINMDRLRLPQRIEAGKTLRRTAELQASVSFSQLGVSSAIQNSLKAMSIHIPTEIQAACIPPLLAGKDCIGNAKTGSGKTLAFALPIIQKLSVDPYGIFALVLTPTRELAFQISEQFVILGNAMNIRTAVIVGGMDMMAQALELGNRPHIVIATPGRIVDHLKSGSGEWNLSRVKFLVLDEADRLLSASFVPELSYLFNVLPKERQTCLFTATLTSSIENIASAPPRPGKQKPFIHRMTESIETVATLKQSYILVPSHVRESYLFHFLCNPPESTLHLRRAPPEPLAKKKQDKSKKSQIAEDQVPQQPPPTIIFCARTRTAAYLTLLLKTLSIRSTALHSRLTQRERLSSLSLFRSSVVPVLISTDVGARGLDIEEVAIIINWDLPEEPEEYTHRVGRTARAGRGGIAVSFVTETDEERVLKIEDRIGVKLEELVLPEDKVLEKLNAVSTAKRLANMEIHDSDFGKRERTNRLKTQR